MPRRRKMDQSTNELIDQIYASVQEPTQIITAGEHIARQCSGIAVQHLKMDMQQHRVYEAQTSTVFLDAQRDYISYYASIDDRVSWFAAGQLGHWQPDQLCFDQRAVSRSEIYNDFLLPYGLMRMAVCRLTENETWQEVLSVARAHDAGNFSEAELQRLAFFSTHLVRAAQLRARLKELESRHAAAQGALDRLPYGALWLDANGRIVWMSPAVATQLAAADGLRIRANRLHCTDPQLDGRLQAALARATCATGREGNWFAVPRRAHPTPWLLSVIPGNLPPDCGPARHGPHALLIVQDGAGPGLPHLRQLQLLYGLTPAEARLALGLLQHETPGSYAERHRLSLATVKTHLSNLFLKTGTRRQADLLRLLALPLPATASRFGSAD